MPETGQISRRALLACIPAFFALPALGQDSYPARPVTLVVTFAAGGGVDVTSRIIGEAMGTILGQRVVIDNRGGGATISGTQGVAKAEPDGYTLLVAPTTMVLNPSFRTGLPFDWRTDLEPIALMAKLPFVVVARPDFPASDMKALENLARQRAQPLLFASGGTGTVAHLAGEMFALRTGIKMQHVAYRGEGPSLTDLAGGTLDVTFATLAGASGQVQSGGLKALGVTSAERANLLPSTPTIAEQGYPDFDVSAWMVLMAPKRTPSAVVERLRAVMLECLGRQDVREKLERIGAIPASGGQDTERFLAREADLWARVIKDSAIKIEQ